MQTTFEVGPHVGRVRYSNAAGDRFSVTVECPKEKVAFRFDSERPLKIGSWMSVKGTTRTDPAIKKDGTPVEKNRTYYHQPSDGTPAAEWEFRELKWCEAFLIAPPEFEADAHDAMLRLRRHLDSWEKNLRLEPLSETAESLRKILRRIDAELAERNPQPVAAVRLTDDL